MAVLVLHYTDNSLQIRVLAKLIGRIIQTANVSHAKNKHNHASKKAFIARNMNEAAAQKSGK